MVHFILQWSMTSIKSSDGRIFKIIVSVYFLRRALSTHQTHRWASIPSHPPSLPPVTLEPLTIPPLRPCHRRLPLIPRRRTRPQQTSMSQALLIPQKALSPLQTPGLPGPLQ